MNVKLAVVIVFSSITIQCQTIFGKWKTVDHETNESKSIVEIYEEDGKVYGKIVELLRPQDKGVICKDCSGNYKGQPVKGMVIIKDMKGSNGYYKGGTIYNPEADREYKCRLLLKEDTPNELQMRGYIAFLYKTQYWIRVD